MAAQVDDSKPPAALVPVMGGSEDGSEGRGAAPPSPPSPSAPPPQAAPPSGPPVTSAPRMHRSTEGGHVGMASTQPTASLLCYAMLCPAPPLPPARAYPRARVAVNAPAKI